MQGRLRTRRHDASDASPKVLASGSGKIRADGLGSHRCGTGPADCLPAVRPHSRAGLIASGQSNRRRPSADPLCLDPLR